MFIENILLSYSKQPNLHLSQFFDSLASPGVRWPPSPPGPRLFRSFMTFLDTDLNHSSIRKLMSWPFCIVTLLTYRQTNCSYYSFSVFFTIRLYFIKCQNGFKKIISVMLQLSYFSNGYLKTYRRRTKQVEFSISFFTRLFLLSKKLQNLWTKSFLETLNSRNFGAKQVKLFFSILKVF